MDAPQELEVCSICLGELHVSDKPVHTLECEHAFHTECIMKWFRSDVSIGSCPLCNDNPNYQENNYSPIFQYSHVFMNERIKNLKKIGRKKDTPANLKKELEKLTDQEKKRKGLVKSRNDFLKKPEIKEYRKIHRIKENSVWKQDTKIYKQKNKLISMFPTIQIL